MRDAAEPNKDSDDLDVLDMLESMSMHFHEHHDVILRWPWKLFCAKWIRLMIFAAEEREREAQRKAEQGWSELRAEHERRWGGEGA